MVQRLIYGTITADQVASAATANTLEDSGLANSGRLSHGSCWGNEIGWTQASAAQDTWYPISDADMSDGQLADVAHDGSGKLTVTFAGKYLINYAVTLECSAVSTFKPESVSRPMGMSLRFKTTARSIMMSSRRERS